MNVPVVIVAHLQGCTKISFAISASLGYNLARALAIQAGAFPCFLAKASSSGWVWSPDHAHSH